MQRGVGVDLLAVRRTGGDLVTIVVEDGTGLADAVSYASVADGNAYHIPRGSRARWQAMTIDAQEAALIDATRLLDSIYTWRGEIVSTSQGLDWPRLGVIDDEGRLIASDALPAGLVAATCELAGWVRESGGAWNPATAGAIQSKSALGATITYRDSGGLNLRQVDTLLRGLVWSGGSSVAGSAKVVRWS